MRVWDFLVILLLLKEHWTQGDLMGRDPPESKCVQDLFPILKGKDIIRAFVSQRYSSIGIDMTHHFIDLFLRVLAQVCAFGDAAANHFVVILTAPFLVGRIRIAIK